MIVDIDNHEGHLTGTDILALKQAGVRKVIVGLQYPRSPFPPGAAHQQIGALINAGFEIECYAQSQHIADVWPRVSQYSQHIDRIWVACEEPHVNRRWIDEHLDFIDGLGKTAGIYTAKWFWEQQEYEHWFGDRPLWAAQYDDSADADAFTPFGDWGSCTMKQYSGDSWIGRLHVDLNAERIAVSAPLILPPGSAIVTNNPLPPRLRLTSDEDLKRVFEAIGVGEGLNGSDHFPMGFDSAGRAVYELHLKVK